MICPLRASGNTTVETHQKIKSAVQENASKPLSVLLADDSDLALHQLKVMLEDLGHTVTAVHNGEQTLAASRAKAFDIILVDMVMPEIDGFDVLKELKAHRPDTPILIFTGHGSMESAIKALRCGADDYLTKPIEKELLDLRINAVMAAKQFHARKTKNDQLMAAIATAGAAAHELNQPLMALMAASELIGLSDDSKRIKELANIITEQTQRMGEITWRLAHIQSYRIMPYTNGKEILDLINSAPYAEDQS